MRFLDSADADAVNDRSAVRSHMLESQSLKSGALKGPLPSLANLKRWSIQHFRPINLSQAIPYIFPVYLTGEET